MNWRMFVTWFEKISCLVCALSLLGGCHSPTRQTFIVKGGIFVSDEQRQPSAEIGSHHKYVVEQGQTLSYIAKKFGVSVQSILAANPGLKPNALRVGQKLVIPTEEKSVVRQVAATTIQEQPSAASMSSLPSYRIISCERETGSEFVYKFSLELTGNVVDPLESFLGIKQKLRTYVRDMYAGANNVSDINSVKVDFCDESISDKLITGRAVVLTMAPVALSYDANARLGRLSVRFNASQYEDARAWARKNIETLARDKNIALVTGVIPPVARFYSLSESLKDGNILEIEFKTE